MKKWYSLLALFTSFVFAQAFTDSSAFAVQNPKSCLKDAASLIGNQPKSRIQLTQDVTKSIKRNQIPQQQQRKLQGWMKSVEQQGINEVRKIPGYHDEPLHGERQGQRSIRLDQQWRAIYVIDPTSGLITVLEITPHKY